MHIWQLLLRGGLGIYPLVWVVWFVYLYAITIVIIHITLFIVLSRLTSLNLSGTYWH